MVTDSQPRCTPADSRGSGLGLAIVRNLVERHAGSVDALSRPGDGTTISIRLPGSGAVPDG
ncbi:MAG: ATP-binding protein [Chloroflexota bacterium]